MTYYKVGDVVKRANNGRRVLIVEVRPFGLRVFYIVKDLESDNITTLEHRNVRPDTQENS